MFELTIKGDIASAHLLRGYEGKCRQMHGHTWKVEVYLGSEKLDSLGMVADLSVLKKMLKEFLGHLDHTCLNDLDAFKENNPTCENIARYIYENFGAQVKPVNILRVQVWESDLASAIYYE